MYPSTVPCVVAHFMSAKRFDASNPDPKMAEAETNAAGKLKVPTRLIMYQCMLLPIA
jgi:hypothetical protein